MSYTEWLITVLPFTGLAKNEYVYVVAVLTVGKSIKFGYVIELVLAYNNVAFCVPSGAMPAFNV